MATFRKLPSGKWQAGVKHGQRRFYKTDPLKRVVVQWAADTEAALRRGTFIDPAQGKQTLTAWWAEWESARIVQPATLEKRRSQFHLHIEPTFGRWRIDEIGSWDVEQWLARLMKSSLSARSVSDVRQLFGQVMQAAVVHRRIPFNPVTVVPGPSVPRHVPRILDVGEVDRLVAAIMMVEPDQHDVPRKGRRPRIPDEVSRVFVRTMTDAGLRYGEAAGLHGFRVDVKRRRLYVQDVLTKAGNVRPYPKTRSGSRTVPLTDELVELLGPLLKPERRDGLVFTTPAGGPLLYDNWRKRIWRPALDRAGLEDPQPTPHDCRHTYGMSLADQGVQPHQIRDLMGHSSLAATEIYLGASEARMEAARAALGAHRAHGVGRDEGGPGRRGGESGA